MACKIIDTYQCADRLEVLVLCIPHQLEHGHLARGQERTYRFQGGWDASSGFNCSLNSVQEEEDAWGGRQYTIRSMAWSVVWLSIDWLNWALQMQQICTY